MRPWAASVRPRLVRIRSSSGASWAAVFRAPLGVSPAPLEIIAITRVVPDLGVLGVELECFLVVRFGLGESAQPIEGTADSPMGQRRVGRPERSPSFVFSDRKGVLIFFDRRVEVPLGLEGAAEIDMHLKLLALGGFFVKVRCAKSESVA